MKQVIRLPRSALPRARAESMGLGDLIATVTKALRIPPCPGCEERRAALNRFRLTKRGLYFSRRSR